MDFFEPYFPEGVGSHCTGPTSPGYVVPNYQDAHSVCSVNMCHPLQLKQEPAALWDHQRPEPAGSTIFSGGQHSHRGGRGLGYSKGTPHGPHKWTRKPGLPTCSGPICRYSPWRTFVSHAGNTCSGKLCELLTEVRPPQ